jgi:(1->4)-alpha-D-glucan 1-alpha-D-glucosylmutase
LKAKRVPVATYRLQFNRLFGFNDARRLVPYLADLGIDTIYASPIFRSRPGSTHGYDIVDHNELNPELGSAGDFDLLGAAVRKRGMGWIQDVVPNHMAFHKDNHMLMEVLRIGEMSHFHDCFDIDWEHPDPRLTGTVMAPFLDRPLRECLERGDIEIRLAESGLYVTYKQYAFPLNIADYDVVFNLRFGESYEISPEGGGVRELLRAARAFKWLDVERGLACRARIEEVTAEIWRLYEEDQTVREFIDKEIRFLERDELDHILSRQRFTLTCWKDTAEAINYRRFFDVNSLIGHATHKSNTFWHTHDLVGRLVRSDLITGIRIDHIDGLRNPEAYLNWLRQNVGTVYTVVEKILARGEQLRWWAVEGTTGYDFLTTLNGLFCFNKNREPFDAIYRDFTGIDEDPREVLYEKKKQVMESNMGADLDNLARWLVKALAVPAVRERMPEVPDEGRLREALVETLAELPVYRTYISSTDHSWEDGTMLAGAVGRAEDRNQHLQTELRLLATVIMAGPRLAGDPLGQLEKSYMAKVMRRQSRGVPRGLGLMDFAMTLQQYMGAVMAKGFEDTFLYVYNRLLSLNEVGGDPIAFGTDITDFHTFNLSRSASHPHTMNATATHDTKRGEDVRARINVLSEIPGEWRRRVKRWAKLNASKKATKGWEEIPDRNDEYALYQTIVGSYPFETSDLAAYRFRVSRFARKAAREAKVHSSWHDPDTVYEDGFAGFAESILTPSEENGFLDDFLPFQRRIAHYGAINSLSQTLIKLCAPGVPDFYQGSELWDLSLVDPDNRRPVDYGRRAVMLEEIIRDLARSPDTLLGECLDNIADGRAKMLLIHRALAARNAKPYLFREGAYVELKASGKLAEHVVAFARSELGSFAVCIVPRFMTGVVGEDEFPLGPEVWGNTTVKLPPGAPYRWREAITGLRVMGSGAISVGEALLTFPVSLLMEDSK